MMCHFLFNMAISKSGLIPKSYGGAIQLVLNLLIASVWLINGLYAKLLGGVPRHESIVERILGSDFSYWLTKGIGIAEMIMMAWVLSRVMPRLCAITQIAVVMLMNLLELALARDLLLFGAANVLFASLFCLVVYTNEFVLRPRSTDI